MPTCGARGARLVTAYDRLASSPRLPSHRRSATSLARLCPPSSRWPRARRRARARRRRAAATTTTPSRARSRTSHSASTVFLALSFMPGLFALGRRCETCALLQARTATCTSQPTRSSRASPSRSRARPPPPPPRSEERAGCYVRGGTTTTTTATARRRGSAARCAHCAIGLPRVKQSGAKRRREDDGFHDGIVRQLGNRHATVAPDGSPVEGGADSDGRRCDMCALARHNATTESKRRQAGGSC